MNFFKTGLQSVLGTNEASETTSGAETVRNSDCFGSQLFHSVSGGATGGSCPVINFTRRQT